MVSKKMADYLGIEDYEKGAEFWKNSISKMILKKDISVEDVLKTIVDAKSLSKAEAVLMTFHYAFVIKTGALENYDFIQEIILKLEKDLPPNMIDDARKKARQKADEFLASPQRDTKAF